MLPRLRAVLSVSALRVCGGEGGRGKPEERGRNDVSRCAVTPQSHARHRSSAVGVGACACFYLEEFTPPRVPFSSAMRCYEPRCGAVSYGRLERYSPFAERRGPLSEGVSPSSNPHRVAL